MAAITQPTLARLNAYGIPSAPFRYEENALLFLSFVDKDPDNRRIKDGFHNDHKAMAYRHLFNLIQHMHGKDLIEVVDSDSNFVLSEINKCKALSFRGGWIDHLERTIVSNLGNRLSVRNQIALDLVNQQRKHAQFTLDEESSRQQRIVAEATVIARTAALTQIATARNNMRGRMYRFPGQPGYVDHQFHH